jgi:hypothetical protein
MRPPVIHNAGETAGGTRMRLEISRYDYFVSVETRVAMGGAAEGEDGVKGDKRGEGRSGPITAVGGVEAKMEVVGEGSTAKDGDGATQDGKTGAAGAGSKS